MTTAPTKDEIDASETDNEIISVGGSLMNQVTYLSFAYRTGDTGLVYLDQNAVRKLVAVLKSLVPQFEAIEGLGVSVDLKNGMTSASSQ